MSSRRQKLATGARGPTSTVGSSGGKTRQQRRKYCYGATAAPSKGGGKQREVQRQPEGRAVPEVVAEGEKNQPEEPAVAAVGEPQVQQAVQPAVAEPVRQEGDSGAIRALLREEEKSRASLQLELEAQLMIPPFKESSCLEKLGHYLSAAQWGREATLLLRGHWDAIEAVWSDAFTRECRSTAQSGARAHLLSQALAAREQIEFEAQQAWCLVTSDMDLPLWRVESVATRLPPGVDAKRLVTEVRLCVGVDAVPWCRGSLYVPQKEAAVRKYSCSLVVDRLPGWATRWNARSLGSIAWQSRFTSKVIRQMRAGDLLYSWVGTAAADGYWHTGDVNLARVCGLNHGDVGITFSMVGCLKFGTAILQVAMVHKVSQPSAITRVILRHTGLLACCRPGDFLVFYEPSAASLGKFALPSVADREVQARASWALAERNLPSEIHASFAVVKTRALGNSDWDLDPFMVRRELMQAAAACLPAGGPSLA